MSTIVQISDFVGNYAIAKDTYNTASIQDVLDEVESKVLNNLLGSALYATFIADAGANSGVPIIAENLAIYNAIQLDNCYRWNYSGGIKLMLKQLIFWTYNRGNQDHASVVGVMKTATANSTESKNNMKQTRIANKGVTSYKVIQQYIELNSSDYPTYDGVEMHFKPLL